MKIKGTFELPISEANKPVIAIVAKELGYDGVIGTPQDYIEKYFNSFFDDLRNKTETGLRKYFGEAGAETTKSILALYDAEVIKSITIEE